MATAAEIRNANPNFGQIINCVFIDCDRSRAIRIFGFKFFHQKVLNAFGITIPRHERLDDFDLIVSK